MALIQNAAQISVKKSLPMGVDEIVFQQLSINSDGSVPDLEVLVQVYIPKNESVGYLASRWQLWQNSTIIGYDDTLSYTSGFRMGISPLGVPYLLSVANVSGTDQEYVIDRSAGLVEVDPADFGSSAFVLVSFSMQGPQPTSGSENALWGAYQSVVIDVAAIHLGGEYLYGNLDMLEDSSEITSLSNPGFSIASATVTDGSYPIYELVTPVGELVDPIEPLTLDEYSEGELERALAWLAVVEGVVYGHIAGV